jgi:hypothetical protein
MWSAVVVCAALLAPALSSDDDDGDDVSAGACDIVCIDATSLSFCDGDEVVTLPCVDVDPTASCALHSEEWGFDCVLPVGTACDPAYAFGRSRCTLGLSCLDGVCAPGTPETPAPAEPTAGINHSTTTTTTTSPVSFLNCQSCGSASMLWLAPLGLWRRRRRGCRR